MAVCPNCGEDIEELKCYTESKSVVSLTENGVLLSVEVPDYSHVQYECPRCDEHIECLEDDEAAVVSFLKST